MAQGLELLQLQRITLTTSREADKDNDWLMGKLGLRARNELARLALARSLGNPHAPPLVHSEDDGRPIRAENFFGDELALWLALLTEHQGRELTSVMDLKDAVRRHWHRGISMLKEDWERSQGHLDAFLLRLAQAAQLKEGFGGETEARADAGVTAEAHGEVWLELGADPQSGIPLRWNINGPSSSPHVAIMGATGSGKTRMANQLLMQMRKSSGAPILLFDMGKGDLAANAGLVAALGARVIRAPREPVPLDVLRLPGRDSVDIINGALRFRESFQRIGVSKAGAAQLDLLRQASEATLRERSQVELKHIGETLNRTYEDKGRKPDTLQATFNELTAFELFKPERSPDDFFQQSWIIDLHEAPETAQRLVVYLMLDALYTWQRFLPEAPLGPQGQRSLRLVVGIDEARKVLGYKQPSLVGLVRESRSKGLSLFMMSQSPDDYRNEAENFLENVGWCCASERMPRAVR